ncbi:MAG: Hsp20/alpha crystallin family protein [Verrucomicrobiales bacterium]|nr:Hsp20/alpha crystallin family protein [Verrucomicrobiales bacterium]MCP5560625.1 Hsp20/alpha crystallin family protein [Verrucomicrobiaceae bacterium]
MNTNCCTPATATRQAAPTCGVDESARKPRYSVEGSPEAYEVRIEMPGVPKSGVTIDLENEVLSIRGERPKNASPDVKSLHRELSDLPFVLRLKLNTPVEEDKLTATIEDGILRVKMPVKEAAKPRRIEIQ